MPRRLGVRARHEHAPLRVLRAAGPDLLPGDAPAVAVGDRARLERGEVGAGVGLGEALAPDLVAGEDRPEEPVLLLARAPDHQRRAAEQDAQHVGRERRPGAAELLEEDRRLGQRRAAPAVLGRPVDRRPAALVHPALEVAPPGVVGLLVRRLRPGIVGGEPVAQLVAEGELGLREGQVHRATLAARGANASARRSGSRTSTAPRPSTAQPRRGNIGRPARQPHMPDSLPQTAGDRLYLTDGGLETTLVFHRGIDLPLFAAFPLLDSDDGRAALREYFVPYLELAAEPRRRVRARHADVARERGLGAAAGLRPRRARPRQPRRGRLRAGAARGRGPGARADPRQRRHRAARGRVRGRRPDDRGGGGGLPRAAGRGLRRGRRGHADRRDDDLRRGGDRRRPRGGRGGPPVRRSPSPSRPTGACRAGRSSATRSPRSRRPRTRVRPTTWSTARTRRTSPTSSPGWATPPAASAGSASTPPARATRSSTRRRSSTRAIPPRSRASTPSCSRHLPNVTVIGGCCGTDARHVAAAGAAWAA